MFPKLQSNKMAEFRKICVGPVGPVFTNRNALQTYIFRSSSYKLPVTQVLPTIIFVFQNMYQNNGVTKLELQIIYLQFLCWTHTGLCGNTCFRKYIFECVIEIDLHHHFCGVFFFVACQLLRLI